MSTLAATNLKHESSASNNIVLTSGGNVGIGTSSPGVTLDVNGVIRSTGTSAILAISKRSTGTGDAWGIYSQSGELNLYDFIAASSRLVIDTSGNVGIGTSSPAGKFASVGGAIQLSGGTTAQEGIRIQRASGYAGIYGINNDNNAYNAIAIFTGASEAMRIDTSGNVGIGTSSPARLFEVKAATTNIPARLGNAQGNMDIGGSDGATVNIDTRLWAMSLQTGSTERARIDTSGNFFVGRTAVTNFNSESGLWLSPVQGISIGKNSSANLGACLYMNRMAAVGDGTLVEFAESNVVEGTISVAGTTVSYNGGHLSRWSQLPTKQRDPALLKGTVLSNLDEMCVWLDAEGNPLPNEQLNRMKISDVEGDPNVAGVFVNWDNDDQSNPYDMNIAMTGDMIIRIAQGVVVQKGDLLMSAGDGTAKPQGDDIRRSKTVAKVTSNHVTCTYPDGSYCVPCVLMAC
jgi:hypothetical protein